MELTPQEQALLTKLETYAQSKGYQLNPDRETVERVVRGMSMRKAKMGEAYCPCRFATGNPEVDKKIICPCTFHEDEIAKNGQCHCQLLMAGGAKP